MTYLIYTIVTIINIYYSFFYKIKNINREDKYYILKENTKRKELLKILQNINNITIVINTISLLLFIIFKINLNILDLIGYFIHLLSYVILTNSKNINKLKKSKETFKLNKEQKNNYIIIYLAIITILILQRVGGIDNSNYSLIAHSISIISLIISIKNIISFLYENKSMICIKQNREEDYLQDVKFTKKICLNNITNYVAFIFVYILIVYINFPFVWILYILVAIILLYTLLDKLKKFKYQANKLTKIIYILHNSPGIKYAFEFYKDIISAKNLLLGIILFIASIISFYLTSTSAFTIITIELFNIYLYNNLCNKKKLIKYIYSLNEEFIDKKILTIEKNFPIDFIEEIEIFKIKFYKIIYMDLNKNIYKSNLILYDPENILNNIKAYINPNNPEDEYIMIIKELYE